MCFGTLFLLFGCENVAHTYLELRYEALEYSECIMGHIQSYGDQPGVSVRSGSNLRDRWSSTFLSRSLHECMFMTDHICACMLWSLLRVSSLGFVGKQLCA